MVAAGLSFGLCSLTGRFTPVDFPDSVTYADFDWSSPRAALSQQRTVGYPAFLRFVHLLSSDPSAVPIAQWVALCGAALLVFRGLRSAGYRRPAAVLAASTLMLTGALLRFIPWTVADSLAISWAVAATGCFLATTARSFRESPADWLGLAACTALASQTRPAYLFLMPLWPLLGCLFDLSLFRQQRSWAVRSRRGLAYLAASLLPFAVFCTIRWAAVGHWGLVSFGGYNVAGVAGQFLEDADLPLLSPVSQPLAAEMLRIRTARPRPVPMPDNFLAMEEAFNPTVWEIAVPAAQHVHGRSPVVVNAALTQLSRELLELHRMQYVRWLCWNGTHAIKQVLRLTLTDRIMALVGLGWLLAHARSLFRGPTRPIHDPAAANATHIERHLLFWTAVAFAGAKLLLVVLVEPANDRYMTGAMPLLPAALGVLLLTASRDVSFALQPHSSR